MPKIPALPPMTSPDTADMLPIEDVSAGSTKYITLTKLKEWFQSLVGWITTAMIGDLQVTNSKVNDVSSIKFYNPYKFSAYRNANQTPTNNAWTKIQMSSEDYDTSNNFDSVTNFRFVAPVAGFYQFSAEVCFNSNANGQLVIVALYKNGSEYKRGNQVLGNPTEVHVTVSPPAIKLNANDYVEAWCYNSGGNPVITGSGTTRNYFGGHLVSTT